jgi:Arc/MetJ-type ribon-helix-helix transcriptional regulator
MAKTRSVKRKKQGRPATGTDPLVGVRLPQELIDAIDRWADREGAASRSGAIRRLLEQALAGGESPRRRTKKSASAARAMAGHELDRLGDRSIPAEERERRKRRLTKGPAEFRDMRGDLPKPKR